MRGHYGSYGSLVGVGGPAPQEHAPQDHGSRESQQSSLPDWAGYTLAGLGAAAGVALIGAQLYSWALMWQAGQPDSPRRRRR